jgi:hypothetical protein
MKAHDKHRHIDETIRTVKTFGEARYITCNRRMEQSAIEYANTWGMVVFVDDSLPDGEMMITITEPELGEPTRQR